MIRDVGSRRELFVDDWLIDRFDDTALRLHAPVARDVALPLDAPWEGPLSHYPSVMRVGSEYRLYYRGSRAREQPAFTCVALSHDGIHWQRPKLTFFSFGASRETNIVWAGEHAHNFAPFLDENPVAPPDERFKAVAAARIAAPSHVVRGLFPFASPDGFAWRQLSEQPMLTDGKFDSLNLAFWDPLRSHYAAYYRESATAADGTTYRSIKHATSPDFVRWTPGTLLDFGDTPPEHLYTNATLPYPRAPHLYLAFPKRYVRDRQRFTAADFLNVTFQRGVSDGVFMSSRDGLRWDRRFMEAFLRPGRDPANWTDRSNAMSWGLLQTAPDELSLYWLEHYHHPTCRIRRGTLRLDGFASLYAGYRGGEAVTHPLRFDGAELTLNFATSAAGSVRVELQDEAGRAIPGFALADCPDTYGDEIERTVCWSGGSDLTRLAGVPVRLRLVLRDADIFSLRFAPRD